MNYLEITILLISTIFLITNLGYALAYVLSLIFNFKIKTPIPVIFTTICIPAALIIQSILHARGFQQEIIYYVFLFITLSIVIFAILYCYLFRRV